MKFCERIALGKWRPDVRSCVLALRPDPECDIPFGQYTVYGLTVFSHVAIVKAISIRASVLSIFNRTANASYSFPRTCARPRARLSAAECVWAIAHAGCCTDCGKCSLDRYSQRQCEAIQSQHRTHNRPKPIRCIKQLPLLSCVVVV